MKPLKYTLNEFHIYDALDVFKIVNIPISLTENQTDCRITHKVIHQQHFALLPATHGPAHPVVAKFIHTQSTTGFGKDFFSLLCPKDTHVEH